MIPKNSKVWTTLANACETPGAFLKAVASLRGETHSSLSKKLGTSAAYVTMAFNNKPIPAEKACYNIAMILNIDPYLLNRVCSDYRMKKIIEKKEK